MIVLFPTYSKADDMLALISEDTSELRKHKLAYGEYLVSMLCVPIVFIPW